MKTTALIPARLESKRFPNKLIKKINGTPIILKTYRSAIDTGLFDNVYVVNSVGITTQKIAGVTTSVAKVTVNTNLNPNGISGFSTGAFLGEYSWGKFIIDARTKELSYPAHTLSGIGTNGLTGISTSSKVYRTKYIRFKKFT